MAGLGREADLSKVADPGLRQVLAEAQDAGLLDVGMDEDLTILRGDAHRLRDGR